MTVAVGAGHPNSGLIGSADVFGALYVGGAGAWIFAPVGEHPGMKTVKLNSRRNLIHEIRAGIGLAVGIGQARSLLESDSKNFAAFEDELFLDLNDEMLHTIGAETKDKTVSLLIAGEPDLVDELRPFVDEPGWSVVLCSESARHVETQWDARL